MSSIKQSPSQGVVDSIAADRAVGRVNGNALEALPTQNVFMLPRQGHVLTTGTVSDRGWHQDCYSCRCSCKAHADWFARTGKVCRSHVPKLCTNSQHMMSHNLLAGI